MMTNFRAKRFTVLMALGLVAALQVPTGPAAAAEKAKPPAASAPPRPGAQPAPPAESPFPALEALESEIARLVETARPSVVGVIARSRVEDLLDALGQGVHIEGRLEESTGGPMAKRVGSGVVIDSKGHIVTLASVVSGASEISVVSSTGQRLPAQLRGLDDGSGIAVLVLAEPVSLRPIRFGDSDTLKPGALVTTFASAIGDSGGAAAYSLGFVSGMGVSLGPLHRGSYLRLNAHSAPGGGGGPVLDAQGRLAGIVFGGGGENEPGSAAIRWIEKTPRPERVPAPPEDSDEDVVSPDHSVRILRALHRSWSQGSGVSYAVPGNVVRRVASEIIQSGYVRRGWVGVRIEEDEPGEVDLLSVVPGSPAEAAGLMPGDRIVSYGIGAQSRQTLTSSAVLVDQIASSAPGVTLKLGILRDNAPKTITLVLGEAPPAARPQEGPPGMPGMPRLHASLMRMLRPTLGVEIDQAAGEDALRSLGSAQGAGLLILKVHDRSRAQEAGMQAGDLIVEAMGLPISTLESLREALHVQGDHVMPVKVLRQRRELILSVQPVPEPPPPPEAPDPPLHHRKSGSAPN